MPTPFDVRISAWRAEYQPTTPVQDWLLEQAVHESLALDAARSELASLSTLEAQRARIGWERDRAVEVQHLASRLAKNPVKTKALLESTAQGCAWLIARWQLLATILMETNEPWDDAQLAHALDLLGTDPLIRGTYDNLNDSASIPPALNLAKDEVSRLHDLKTTTLDPLNALERAAAERGEPLNPSKPLARAKRALDAAHRRYQAAHALLLKSLPAPHERPEPRPAPAPKPPATPSPLTNIPADLPKHVAEQLLASALASTTPPKLSNISANVRN